MRFLVTNDDGIEAPGIQQLVQSLKEMGHVDVIAPHTERSGQSHAISLTKPLRAKKNENGMLALTGTPADCIMFGLQYELDIRPDWVISGINRGGNLGTDLLYSGTVAGAMEGCILGIPSIAVSLEGVGQSPLRYDVAATILLDLLEKPGFKELATGRVVNLNVPNRPMSEIKGIKTAKPGRRFYEGRFLKREDPRNIPYYWVGAAGYGHKDIEGSDCNLCEEGYATISILKPSFFDEDATKKFESQILCGP